MKNSVFVTFKPSNDKLVGMFTIMFNTAKEAKKSIEEDAKHWLKAHGKVAGEWVNPDTKDYYMAVGKDGETCIWQYFQLVM